MVSNPWRWWHEAVAGFHPPINISEPHCGYFKTKLVKDGPFVPVHIFWRGPKDEHGRPTGDEEMVCLVNGKEADVLETWTRVADRPIQLAEYEYLVNLGKYAKEHDSREPLANPTAPIDRLTAPIPTFKKRKK